jgi:hypothetical protein
MEIPTADLMLTKNISFEIGNKLHDSLDWISIVDCMKEFAKLHVKAALEKAYNNRGKSWTNSKEESVKLDLFMKNSYSLENIK